MVTPHLSRHAMDFETKSVMEETSIKMSAFSGNVTPKWIQLATIFRRPFSDSVMFFFLTMQTKTRIFKRSVSSSCQYGQPEI